MPWSYGSEGREWESEWELKRDDAGWVGEGESLYDNFLDTFYEDFGLEGIEQEVADALYSGWFGDVDDITRAEARFDFFDLTGMEYEDFPWEEWSDWYES
jgi:hypothetical protein